jgi:hypothetical protein
MQRVDKSEYTNHERLVISDNTIPFVSAMLDVDDNLLSYDQELAPATILGRILAYSYPIDKE